MLRWLRQMWRIMRQLLRVENGENFFRAIRGHLLWIGALALLLFIGLIFVVHSWIVALVVACIISAIVLLEIHQTSRAKEEVAEIKRYFTEERIYPGLYSNDGEEGNGGSDNQERLNATNANEENRTEDNDQQEEAEQQGQEEEPAFDAKYHTTREIQPEGWRYWVACMRYWILADIIVLIGIGVLLSGSGIGIAFISVIVIALATAANGIEQVEKIHKAVISVAGKRTACVVSEGWTLILGRPFFMDITEVSMKLRRKDVKKQIAFAGDRLRVRADTLAHFRPRNVNLYLEVEDIVSMIEDVQLGTYRENIAGRRAEESITEPGELRDAMKERLDRASDSFGTETTRTLVTEIKGATDEVDDALEAEAIAKASMKGVSHQQERVLNLSRDIADTLNLDPGTVYELVSLGVYQPEQLSKKISKHELGGNLLELAKVVLRETLGGELNA